MWTGCRMYGPSKMRNRQLCPLIKCWNHFWLPFWLLLSRLVHQLKSMYIIDPSIIFLILVHLENVFLQCKDSEAVEGTMECLEPDSICLVKRVGMCMLLLSWKSYWMLKVEFETKIWSFDSFLNRICLFSILCISRHRRGYFRNKGH